MKRLPLISVLVLIIGTKCLAQAPYDDIKGRFPNEVGEFKAYDDPEISGMTVNGERTYYLSAYYEKNVDTYCSLTLTSYDNDPGFIEKMVQQLKQGPPSDEDEENKWRNFQTLGYPTQLTFQKKYSNHNVTVLVTEPDKPWLLTIGVEGSSEEEILAFTEGLLKSIIGS